MRGKAGNVTSIVLLSSTEESVGFIFFGLVSLSNMWSEMELCDEYLSFNTENIVC